ncbi:MAG: DUF4386 domain-containing protein [Acidimicrobiia bacterium]
MTAQVTTRKPSDTHSGESHSGGVYPRRRAARIAGVSYLAMFLLAIFANFVVREGLIEPGNASGTVANIRESIGLFRLGLAAFLAIFVLDVVIAWALHVIFRDVNRDVSLVTAWFRLIYTALLGVALVSMFQVLQVLGGESLGFLTSTQVNTQTMIELSSFESTWLIGLVAFGIHLAMLGVLISRSGLVAKALGYVLFAAGMAYVLDTLARGMLADYEAVAGVFLVAVAVPSMIGEGWLGLWLLLTKKLEARTTNAQ